jgi:hypothetical protein
MITTADLNRLKESLTEGMKINFKNDGKLMPVAIVIAPDGKMTHIVTPYENQEEKALMMNAVRAICKNVDAIAVGVINEAWIRMVKKEDSKKALDEMKETGKRVSDYDDKKEVAFLMFETKLTGESITFDIDRTNNELINKRSGRTSGGDFANILSPILQEN